MLITIVNVVVSVGALKDVCGYIPTFFTIGSLATVFLAVNYCPCWIHTGKDSNGLPLSTLARSGLSHSLLGSTPNQSEQWYTGIGIIVGMRLHWCWLSLIAPFLHIPTGSEILARDLRGMLVSSRMTAKQLVVRLDGRE